MQDTATTGCSVVKMTVQWQLFDSELEYPLQRFARPTDHQNIHVEAGSAAMSIQKHWHAANAEQKLATAVKMSHKALQQTQQIYMS